MTGRLKALALAGLFALWGPVSVGAQEAGPETLGPGSAVPFVAQGPLLCGGASAAMVQRYWGALGVYAEDFRDLVSREAGGIRTNELAGALRKRGLRTEVLRDRPAEALGWLLEGVPVIALLESGKSRYHYVVVVASGPDEVRFHDPLRGPDQSLSRSAFLARWAPSRYWALLAMPDPGTEDPDALEAGEPGAVDAVPDTAGQAPAGAETPLPGRLQAALQHLRSDEPEAAAESASAYLATVPDSAARRPLALDMLASARYLAGDPMGALVAWNRIGAPGVDLVHVRGLRTLRFSTVADPLGIEPRQILTPARLRLARRRLSQLPAVRLGRVGYEPLRDGSVAVQAAILERPRWPLSVPGLVGIGIGALVNQQAEADFGPVLPVGERWRVQGAWQQARSQVEGAVDVPWTPAAAVVTLRSGWTEERYPAPGGETIRSSRTLGAATVRKWVTSVTRLGLTLGLERWDDARLGRLGLSVLQTTLNDGSRLGLSLDGWLAGGGAHGLARAGFDTRLHTAPGRELSATAGAALASRGTPPTLWDGAGVGHIRQPLLRGHPLDQDGRIGGAAFGRGLLYGSLAHSWFIEEGPARAAVTLFVDGARVWFPLDGDAPRSYVDPGLELNLSSDLRTVAVSLARGGNDWVLSARVGTVSLPWLHPR